MPGEMNDPYLSPWSGYYEQRVPETYTWMDDERQKRPLKPNRGKKNQNKMVYSVLRRYLNKEGNPDARSK